MLKNYRNQLTVLAGVVILAVAILASAIILTSADINIKSTGGTDPSGKFLNTISVSGDGKVFAKPDMAVFSVTVTTTKPSSKEALDTVNNKVAEVKNVLKGKDIKDEDVQTSYLSVSPEYDWTDQGRKLLGQRATQTLSIKVKKIDDKASKVAEVIDEVAKISEVEINAITFDIEDKTTFYKEARKLAFEKAKQKAEELADLGGVGLGDPVSMSDVSYDSATQPQSNVAEMVADKAAGSAGSTDISIGQLELSISINVSFEID